MRIAIQTLGTCGDVQPGLALARGLIDRGDKVRIAAPKGFAALARHQDVPFAPLPSEVPAPLDTPDGKAAASPRRGLL